MGITSDPKKIEEIKALAEQIADVLGDYLVNNHIAADDAINSISRAAGYVIGSILHKLGDDVDDKTPIAIMYQFSTALKKGMTGEHAMSVKFSSMQ